MPETGNVTIDSVLAETDEAAVVAEIRHSLAGSPREIPSHFFYDERGSELFERICELPEYYQTRTEHALLETVAGAVIEQTAASELVELGAGAATKTRVLLDAMQRAGRLRRYRPLDVDGGMVRRVAGELTARYPDLRVHGVVGDFTSDLEHIPDGRDRLFVFLGSTLGNFDDVGCSALLRRLADQMNPGEHVLLGLDLIKDAARIEAAYDDGAGVTAAFNRNILRVLNRIADGDFEPAAFEHRAFYNEADHRNEMWLRATGAQVITLRKADLTLRLAAGDEIRTELSVKYDRPLVERLLAEAGLRSENWFTDDQNLFGLSLARKP